MSTSRALKSELSDETAVLLRQDVSGCCAAATGGAGLSDDQYDAWLTRAGAAVERLRVQRQERTLPLLDVGDDLESVAAIEAAYAELADGAKTLVFFGTGGSSLGGQTVAQFGGWSIPGVTTADQRNRPATRFYDNLDGDTLSCLLENAALETYRFVVVSKSGNTPETLSQAIATLDAVRETGLAEKIPQLFLGITEPPIAGRRNGLRDLFSHFGIPLLEHHTGIGGRFAALTNVGLLPAIARGLDARAILRGARAAVRQLEDARQPTDLPAGIGAAVAVGLSKDTGIRNLVMMPYADRLRHFSNWYVQLWAESLGKNGEGTTPIACAGPVDQHSQLQLFMDGPREHMVSFIRVPTRSIGPVIAKDLAALAGFEEMSERCVGDLVAAQAMAVPEALRLAGRPVRIIDVVSYDSTGLGALLMHFMMETILAGYILGLDPFDQPAVELGKRLTREKLT